VSEIDVALSLVHCLREPDDARSDGAQERRRDAHYYVRDSGDHKAPPTLVDAQELKSKIAMSRRISGSLWQKLIRIR
jgi:hypothetical protein